jgi:hypothetical protein
MWRLALRIALPMIVEAVVEAIRTRGERRSQEPADAPLS